MLRQTCATVLLLGLVLFFGAGCPKQAPVSTTASPESASPAPAPEPAPKEETPAPAKVEGAIEGESLKVLETTAGQAEPQEMTGWAGDWSGGSILWWRDGEPGARLTLGFDVPADGRYKVVLQPVYSFDYAIVKVALDDQPPGDEIDLYAPDPVQGKPIDLGEQDLTKGQHKLVVEVVGISDKASEKMYGFGLDYLKLEPAPAAAP